MNESVLTISWYPLVQTWKTTSGLVMQSMQMPEMTLVRKKGSQQMMNTPITVPRVLAAFFSLANLVTFGKRECFTLM